jgi:DNA-binding FadR family transcriptional regulator
VAHHIGREIVIGKIAEGAMLPRESELADIFGVSRQAIREALKVLAAKGLVTSRRRTGTQVQPRHAWNLLDPDVLAWHPLESLPPKFFQDLGELRRVVEPAAAAFAASRGTPEAIAEIRDALSEMQRTVGDPAEFNLADIRFHMAIFAASGNELFERLAFVIGPLLETTFHAQSERRISAEGIIAPHLAVYNAIAAREAERARSEMETIVTLALQELGMPGT